MAAFWRALPTGLITVLDVNASPSGAFAAVQAGFQGSEASLLAAGIAGGLSPSAAQAQVVANYHADVLPFCALAARGFFSQF